MRLMKRLAVLTLTAAFLAALGLAGWGWLAVHTPYQGYEGEAAVDIPAGSGSRDIVELLHSRGVIGYRYPALAWLYLSDYRGKLQAGEYAFDTPMDADAVLAKLADGDVRLYAFTIPEGFRIDQIADRWEETGFGDRDEFLRATEAALPMVQRINPRAESVEGYLFPETYSLPRAVTADQAVEAMVRAFEQTLARVEREVPRSEWPLDLHDTLILASLVESEVAVAEERGLVASVFLNRLDRNMRLECDATVVYALVRNGGYQGRILRADLALDSPYNTYLHPELPPGAISNPGYLSLLAAADPARTDYLFFVRTEGGRHTFSRTLAEHNVAVAEYRRMSN